MFVIGFTTSNYAFKDDEYGEIASILDGVKHEILEMRVGDGGLVHDTNGNTIGFWRYDAE